MKKIIKTKIPKKKNPPHVTANVEVQVYKENENWDLKPFLEA